MWGLFLKKVYEPSPHKDVCSTIGMGFLDSTLTYIDDIDWLVPPRMPVTIRICHYHCLLRGIPINPPFRYRDRGLSPQRHGRNGGATEDGYERSGAICLRSLAEDLATGSKIPSPNGEFLETSWELIINKLSNSQGYPVRGRGQYQTPWYILCFVADNLHVTTFWINFNKTWNHVENQSPKL